MEQNSTNRKFDFGYMIEMNSALFSLFEEFCDKQDIEFDYALETALLEFISNHISD